MTDPPVSFELESNRESPFYPSIARMATRSIAAESVADCAGLTLLRAWLEPAASAALFAALCAEFGFTPDDSTPNQAMFHARDAMPPTLQALADALASSAAILNALNDDSVGLGSELLSRFPLFDQAIVNHYCAGSSGIAEHVDLAEFDDGIVGLSLGGACVFVMRLRDAESGGAELARRDVELRAGDVVLLRGDARHRWTHAIDATPERRVSITFRKRLVPPRTLNQ
jgi:alkylated DNA repair dioxygenase AlkB